VTLKISIIAVLLKENSAQNEPLV